MVLKGNASIDLSMLRNLVSLLGLVLLNLPEYPCVDGLHRVAPLPCLTHVLMRNKLLQGLDLWLVPVEKVSPVAFGWVNMVNSWPW